MGPVGLSSASEGMLAAMTWVVTHPPEEDTTHEQRHYRSWLKDNKATFLSKKAELEKAALGAAAKGVDPGGIKEDEGVERAREALADYLECLADEARGPQLEGSP